SHFPQPPAFSISPVVVCSASQAFLSFQRRIGLSQPHQSFYLSSHHMSVSLVTKAAFDISSGLIAALSGHQSFFSAVPVKWLSGSYVCSQPPKLFYLSSRMSALSYQSFFDFFSHVCSQPPKLFYLSSRKSALNHQIFFTIPFVCLLSLPKLFFRSSRMTALSHHSKEPY
ncbi:hypothetical protein AVEN_43858-1, partial [Araneus ventricosus]